MNLNNIIWNYVRSLCYWNKTIDFKKYDLLTILKIVSYDCLNFVENQSSDQFDNDQIFNWLRQEDVEFWSMILLHQTLY